MHAAFRPDSGTEQIAEHVGTEKLRFRFPITIDVYVNDCGENIGHGFDQPWIHTRRSEGYHAFCRDFGNLICLAAFGYGLDALGTY